MSYRVALSSDFARQRAANAVLKAPDGYICRIEEPKRTVDQNSRLWAMLSDVAMSKPMGRMHTPEEWKCIFMSACGWDVAFLPGLDGRFLPYGYRSSKLTKRQMTDLQDFIQAWGDENGVRWSNEAKGIEARKGGDAPPVCGVCGMWWGECLHGAAPSSDESPVGGNADAPRNSQAQ